MKRIKLVSLLLVLVMLFSLCGCGAQAPAGEEKEITGDMESVADDKSDTEKEEMKSAFIVEINGKEYDLAGNYMTLLSEFIDDGMMVIDALLNPYKKDGSVDEEKKNDVSFYDSLMKNGKIMSMSENLLAGSSLIINKYSLNDRVGEFSVQESVQELMNAGKKGIYADGKLID